MRVISIMHAAHVLESTAMPIALERVPAGFPSAAQDYFDGDLNITDLLVPNAASTFFMVVAGHSMTGAGITDGSLVVIDRSIEPADGHIVAAFVDGDLTLKRLRVNNASVTLCAANPAYPDIQVPELSELVVWGVVTWTVRRAERE